MKLVSVFMLALAFSVTACKKPTTAESFEKLVQDYYKANGFTTQIDVVKDKTLRGGSWVVIKTTDPVTGETWYVAGNLENYKPGMTVEELLTAGFEETWVSPYTANDGTVVPGVYADANGYLYERSSAGSKDLEKVAAFAEAAAVAQTSEKLVSQFGLSEERGLQVAKLLNNFSKISKNRAVTTADANSFSKELLGADFSSLQTAIEAGQVGDSSKMNSLIEKAAVVNGVSPEHMSEIISEIVNN